MTAEHLTSTLLTPVATLAVVMVGFLYNNSRMNDLRSDLKDLLKAELGRVDATLGAFRTEIDATLGAFRAEIEKNHSEMLRRFGDLDGRVDGINARLTHIESQLGIQRA